MANLVMFCILAVIILGSAVMCVMTKSIMRAATFLLFVLFGVAGIYFLLDYTFLGAAQISIYAGGITIMYIFAIQLLSKRTLQGMVERVKGSRIWQGAFIAVAGAVTVITIFVKNNFIENYASNGEVPIEKIGTQLLSSGVDGYVLPFEFISLFLLACIIGGTLIGKKGDDE
ncbi:MAG: NADH-quinone oxidoreductase subunit J [Prevotella sp.]|uniref:NADH-quinone oxidoreductase subunit J family protein n=1 Tax=Prevotella sp. P3-122 TaxID=2024223 RepID=UPI000B965BE9|nr:NADH-quinone oxidoreductase subunit J [Prevotella sp. P3-122]MCI6463002.1 NADH-quinone oxidoreductase subunit J [Prevotella sp.]MCI6501426.1 NADH-quinone oxidoreductase subunit J [Prevotella sp.]MCI6555322.1 NADH-quinone oxidoreductase subunit J [Prevotella sp.]MCI7360658.1 NADH-quinone oxidoreductase subunit J [Prevotella sp.]MCI7688009.1 NADH-quinone oxidoreductase subunit J [Prevotella sp.]